MEIEAYLTDAKECQNNCNYNGLCFQGECVCQPQFVGFDCSQ